MPLSSLVLTVTAARPLEKTCQHLALTVSGLELGQPNGHRVPAILDAPDYPAHDKGLEALRGDSTVLSVEVVFHDFSDVSEFGDQPARRRRR